MTPETSQKMDPNRLKSFVRHVCIISKKHKDREQARVDLQRQMQRLKRFSSKKKEMDEELKELNKKVSLVLEKERQLLGIEKGESEASKQMMRMAMENKEAVRKLNNSIDELKGRLRNYVEMKTKRTRRINELERKIKGKVRKRKDVSLLKAKLKKLEDMYNRLKKKGVDVSRIEGKITDLKLRLG